MSTVIKRIYDDDDEYIPLRSQYSLRNVDLLFLQHVTKVRLPGRKIKILNPWGPSSPLPLLNNALQLIDRPVLVSIAIYSSPYARKP